jgi:hypothetical protein
MTVSIPVFGNKWLGQNAFLTLFLTNERQFQCFSDTTAQTGPKQTHSSCSEITQTHSPCRAPPNMWSARRRDRYIHNTQQTQEANSYVLCGIRTHYLKNQEAADLRLTPLPHSLNFLTWPLLAGNRRHKQKRKTVWRTDGHMQELIILLLHLLKTLIIRFISTDGT